MPLIVTGESDTDVRAAVAAAVLDVVPERPWVILDGDADRPDAETLGATLRGGVTPAVLLRAPSLKEAMDRRPPSDGLPEDAVRRLGAVLVVEGAPGHARACRRPLPAAHRARCPGARPAAPAGGPRHVGPRHGCLRALRLGHHPGAGRSRGIAAGGPRGPPGRACRQPRQTRRRARCRRPGPRPRAGHDRRAGRLGAAPPACPWAHAPAKPSGLHSALLDPPRDPHVH